MKNIFILSKGCLVLLVLLIPVFHSGYSQEKSTNPCLQAMSSQERDMLSSTREGMLIMNTSTGCINYFTKGKWKEFCEPTPQQLAVGTVVYDSLHNSFKIYTGERWIPLETFTRQFKLINEDQPVTQSKQDEEEGNGEIMATENTPKTGPDDCHAPPTTAEAGNDLVDLESVNLNANIPDHGIGHWMVLKGDSGIIKEPSNPHSAFTGKQGVTYTLRWLISTRCDTSYDDVLIRIRFPCSPEPSQSNAGKDRHNVEICYLNANVPKSGKGMWSIESGIGGKIHSPEIHNSLFSGEPGETYILRWTIRTKCGLTQDDLRITFKPPCKPDPSQANAGEDQLDVTSCILNGNKPEHGNGKWYIVSGNGGKIISPTRHNSEFEGIPEETYWLKWVISNECGKTEDGLVVRFKKSCPARFVDARDGKTYAAVEIGDQCWMASNLDYRGGSYHCYEDIPDNCKIYGALYSWEEAMNNSTDPGSKGACPDGWHVPTDEEWETLVKAPGIDAKVLNAGGESGFNLNYGGTRYPNGRYFNKREYAFYWSSSANKENTAWNRYFGADSKEAEHYSTNTENGFSVRCVQD